jgi:tetratricopeptide (TPR) repeat protein
MFTYPRWQSDVANPYAWLALLLCICVFGGLIVMWRRGARGICLALLFYAVTIFPALGFSNFYPMRFSFVADHFVYHASLGVIAMVVGGVTVLLKDRAVSRALLAAVVVAYAALTFKQGSMYADETTLWHRTLALNPDSFMAHNNLAAIASRDHDFRTSEYHSRESIRLKGDDFVPYANLAYALRAQGKTDEAVKQADRAIGELDRWIDSYRAADIDAAVDQLWALKTRVLFDRSEMVKSIESKSGSRTIPYGR